MVKPVSANTLRSMSCGFLRLPRRQPGPDHGHQVSKRAAGRACRHLPGVDQVRDLLQASWLNADALCIELPEGGLAVIADESRHAAVGAHLLIQRKLVLSGGARVRGVVVVDAGPSRSVFGVAVAVAGWLV